MSSFHLPAKFVANPLKVLYALLAANLTAEFDRTYGWIYVHIGRHTMWIMPETSRIHANVTLDVEPGKKGVSGAGEALVHVSAVLSDIGGEPVPDNFGAELDFIAHSFADFEGVAALVAETRGHYANMERYVADVDFESAVYHRDLRDKAFSRLIAASRFYG